MRGFDFYAPDCVEDAINLLTKYKQSLAIVAGGTDIVIELNERKINPAVIIDIKKLKSMDYIRLEDTKVRMGALTSFTAIAENDFIKKHVKVLYDAARQVGSPQIRNLGTIGGNLASSSVAGDGLSAMTTLDASVELKSTRGTRVLKLNEFLAGEGVSKRNALKADELLTEVFFDAPDKNTATAFYKLAKRRTLAISVIGGGMLVQVDANRRCTKVSMRGGALARYPLEFVDAQNHLLGKKLALETMQETLPMLHDAVYESAKNRPWSVFYKKESVQGVFNKLFVQVLDQLT